MLSTFTRITRVLTAVAFALGFAVSAHAQAINTAPLSGVVRNESGQPVSGAKIKITHEPTGTVTQAVTNTSGVFEGRGLRPGGPYDVVIDAGGYATTEIKDVYLDIEAGAYLTAIMQAAEVVRMEKYTVTANTTTALYDPQVTDKSTFINSRDIQNMAVGDRTLSSIIGNDPRVIYNRDPAQQYISVSGINNRYNSIMVDGVSVSDPFGLNANNMAAFRNVIPIEAIESVAVSTAPYNVRKGGFIGASVNAVTKSGGNDFHGSVYYTFRNQDLTGEHMNGNKYPLSDFEEQTFGATLGGPIVPKKLFFFGSFERIENKLVAPAPQTWASDSTLKIITDGIAQLNSGTAPNGKVINTGTNSPFNPGTVSAPSGNKLTDTEALAKLDWQISADHRVSLQYKYSNATRPTFAGFGTGAAAAVNNFSFNNTWYDKNIKNISYMANWIAQWSDKFNTEASVSYSKYDSNPSYNVKQPSVTIQQVPVPNSTSAYATWGTDSNYQLNSLSTKTKTAELFGSYKLGYGHTLEAGVQYNATNVYNLYLPSAFGTYTFGSLADFTNYVNGLSTNYYGFTYKRLNKNSDGSFADPSARFTDANGGVFIRDSWRVNQQLSLDLGVRLDAAFINDSPAYNQKFEKAFGFRNDSTYDGKTVVQPRLGFNWQPKINDGKLHTVVRGGAGLFYGAMPRVWMANSFQYTGLTSETFQTGTNNGKTQAPILSSDPYAQMQSFPATSTWASGTAGQQTVNAMDPNFQLPTRWKGNIAIEQELGLWGMKFTAELEGTKVEKDVRFVAINLKSTRTGPDGRPLYWSYDASGKTLGQQLVSTDFAKDTVEITNTDKGSTAAVTLSLERPMKKDGWSWLVAYVNTRTREAAYGNASVAYSTWYSRTAFDPNAEELHRGDGEIRNRYLINVTKKLDVFKFGSTYLTVTFNRHSGLPYSFAAGNKAKNSGSDVNGDSQRSNDLMYIPSRSQASVGGNTPFVFASQADYDNFYKIVDQYGLKEGAKTTINGQTYPWVTQFDIHLGQEVKLPGWHHSLEFAVDVLNFGNLLNDKWGVIYGSNQAFVKYEYLADVAYDGQKNRYTYSSPNTDLLNRRFVVPTGSYVGEPASSRWSILLSVKYKF